LRLFSFGGYGLALAALALVVFGAYDSYPVDFKGGALSTNRPQDAKPSGARPFT